MSEGVTPDTRPDEAITRRRTRRKTIGGILTATALIASGAAATNLRAYSIPSSSMSPTLGPGDRVLTVSPRFAGTPKRGEVWVFRYSEPGAKSFIKRVVAVPGDTVAITDGKLLVNDSPVNEPYLSEALKYESQATKLGTGQFFVLGDNRNNSNDSHVFGPVGGESFLGKVEFRYWPPNKTGGI
jgi:signal peptidase I